MKRILRIGPLMLLGAVACAGVVSAGSDVHIFLGQKQISDSDLEDLEVDKPSEVGLGVNLDFDWPVTLTIDVLHASDDATYSYDYRGSYDYKIDVETTELHAGVRYEFLKDGKIKPYIGGGLAWVDASGELTGTFSGRGDSTTLLDDSDSDVSYFVGAGVLFEIGSHFNLGLDLRQSDAEVELTPELLRGSSSFKVDVGGLHYGVTAGYRW